MEKKQTSQLSGKTILEAVENKVKSSTKTYHVESDISEAVDLAEKAEVAIVCVGEGAYIHSSPWGPHRLSLPEKQLNLVRKISKKTPTIAVLSMGRPYIIPYLKKEISGILVIYYPGNQGGQAAARVLFGEYNPTGHLPFRLPSSMKSVKNQAEDEPYDIENYTYKEGHGLSYPKVSLELSDVRENKVILNVNSDFSSYESGWYRVKWKKKTENWKNTKWFSQKGNHTRKVKIQVREENIEAVFQAQIKYRTRIKDHRVTQKTTSNKLKETI